MEFIIQKGIPMPRASKSCRYPLAQMEIGDSFYTDRKSPDGFHTMASHRKIKIAYRKEGEGYRIWRTA